MNILCKIFGHKMYCDTYNVAGPSTCKRCGCEGLAIDWSSDSPMPQIKFSERKAKPRNFGPL